MRVWPLVKNMKAKEIIVKALHENFSEFTEDQADAVLEALKLEGFVLIQSPISAEMQTSGKQALGLGMFGYDMQDALDAMIEAQEQSHD